MERQQPVHGIFLAKSPDIHGVALHPDQKHQSAQDQRRHVVQRSKYAGKDQSHKCSNNSISRCNQYVRKYCHIIS